MTKPLLAFAVLAATAAAQWIDYKTPGTPRTRDGKANLNGPVPRARDGHANLSGIWSLDYAPIRIPAGTVIATSQQPDTSLQFFRGGAPVAMTPWAEAIFNQRNHVFGLGRPASHCLPHSIPDAMLVDNFKIVQDPGLTLVLYEEFARFRQIFTDGRTFPKEMNPAWLGYSIGRWDKDSLVVDTRGYNDLSWLDDAGHPHSEQLHTVERFHRRDFGHMDIDFTIEDPKAYPEPWSFTLHFLLMPDTELIEDVCDNEHDQTHLVGRVADDERKIGIDLPASALTEYAGAYLMKTPEPDFAYFMDVSLAGGSLLLSGSALTPLSETEFSSTFGRVKFSKERDGSMTMTIGWATGGEDEFVRKK